MQIKVLMQKKYSNLGFVDWLCQLLVGDCFDRNFLKAQFLHLLTPLIQGLLNSLILKKIIKLHIQYKSSKKINAQHNIFNTLLHVERKSMFHPV